MGKTYIDTVKYMIKARFEIDGIIEKPDIVGAIFGQTEGLLGEELDLRELQKNGRIGRIEVEMQVRNGRTNGVILVPSSLDMVETSILAAALETVDRVGPCEARINTEKIEDSRNTKRKQVLDRAKNLLGSLMTDEMPESKELSEMVRESVKVAEITSYGEDKLPAGPDITRNNEIIFVEGRADVINLLKNGIKNSVAIGGANVGQTIARLGREKEVTVFLDGDRGGDIILRELQAATDIDFVARAPPGREVEELTRKELIKCLRARVPIEEAHSSGMSQGYEQRPPRDTGASRERFPQRPAPHSMPPRPSSMPMRPAVRAVSEVSVGNVTLTPDAPMNAPAEPIAVTAADYPREVPALRSMLKELEGTLKARLLSDSGSTVAEVPIREVMKALSESNGVSSVALDGIVTQRLVDMAEQKGVTFVAGIRAGNIAHKPAKTKIVLAE
ncbi:MAG TPA: DNA primase DnaG [Candidatus Norongarragalinales archaeon]|jgi:DNA primase|nr:DNA primase DnaG [Candidatus Norongarragalinales archaeon]